MDNLSGAEDLASRALTSAGESVAYPILYTSGDATVPRAYNAYNRLNDGLATPAVFIIDTAGRIVWQDIGRHKVDRVSGRDVLRNLP